MRSGTRAEFVGTARCAGCHAEQANAFRNSHHDRAIEVATPESVLAPFDGRVVRRDGQSFRFIRDGDTFFVETSESGGSPERLRVSHSFGVSPLEQWLVTRPAGRRQVLPIAWDTRPSEHGGQRFFDLLPDERTPPADPLHWDGLAFSWNSQCAACHSTHLEKGFDVEGNRYQTRWAELDVGCEACHGPGSRHVALVASSEGDDGRVASGSESGLPISFEVARPERWRLGPGARIAAQSSDDSIEARDAPSGQAVEIELCASCHSRRARLLDPPAVDDRFLDGHRPRLLDPGLYFEDGQIRDEVYVWGSFLQSRMYAAGVRCSDCHEPHTLSLRRSGRALCLGCHSAEAYDVPTHRGHAESEGSGGDGGACIDCHMPARTYMQIDARRDHAFPVPRPEISAVLGAPDVCRTCHPERSPAWASRRIASWGDARPATRHWSERLVRDGQRRAGPDPWLELARDRSQPAIVRASAWRRLAEEGPSGIDAGALAGALREANELELLGLIDLAATRPPAIRARLLSPLVEHARRAIRTEAAAALADVPANAFSTATRSALARALREYRSALENDAERPEAQLNLARLAASYGDTAEARLRLARAIERTPYFVPAYVNLADLERAAGNDAAAHDWLSRAVEIAPDDALTRYAYGLSLHRLGRGQEAERELGRAAQTSPDMPRLTLAWALSLEATGDTGRAIDVLEAATRRSPHDAELSQALARLRRSRAVAPDP